MRIPSSVRTVADIIGMPGAVRLLQVARNNAVYVPAKEPRPDHPLTRVLQPDELRALQHHFGGELLSYAMPSGARRINEAGRKRAAVLRLAACGMSRACIARELGLKDGHVRVIISREAKRAKRKADAEQA